MELKISYQKLRTSELQNFEILNFYNRREALGIEAASFASGTGNGIREREMGNWMKFFERGEMKRAKIERKARRLCRNAQKKSHQDTETTSDQVEMSFLWRLLRC